MRLAWQYVRSVLFIAQMYLMMAVFGLFGLPFLLFGSDAAHIPVRAYCHWVRWTAGWMVGLRSEIRGPVPDGPVLIAAKHQSFFDIILIASAVPRFRAIMKKELLWAPIVGWYAKALGCVAVDRGKRGVAITRMVAAVKSGKAAQGQLVIYPQGTRVAAGAKAPYKVGAAVLYAQLEQPCIPVAVNVGVFWPRHGILRKPGLAVAEFLPAIPPGLSHGDFMRRMQHEVETNSDRLMAEAGFRA